MIKKYGFLLLAVFLFYKASAQKDYTITITVNLEDCLNCNATIFDLRNFKDSFDVQIIMREEFQSDSSFIYKEYDFKDVVENITFSDSLFNLYSPANATMISIESKYKIDRFSMHIKETYDRGFFTYLKKIMQNDSMLFEKHPEASRGANELKINNKGLAAFNVPYKKSVYIYDFLNETFIDEIQISQEIYKDNFILNDDGILESEYDSIKTVFKENNIPISDKIETIFYKEDTLCVMIISYYVMPYINSLGKEDLRVKGTYGIAKYLDGEFLGLYKFQTSVKDKSKDIIYVYQMNVHHFNDKLYTSIGSSLPVKNSEQLGIIDFKDNAYNINFANYSTSAAVYDKSFDFSIPVFYKNAYALPIIGKIYNLENGELLETLPFFKDTEEIHPRRSPEMLLFGNAFVINEDYVWVKVHDNIKKEEVFYKMNRKTKKHEISSFNLTLKLNNIIYFDPLNPDYVIYKEEKTNKLIRKKIF